MVHKIRGLSRLESDSAEGKKQEKQEAGVERLPRPRSYVGVGDG